MIKNYTRWYLHYFKKIGCDGALYILLPYLILLISAGTPIMFASTGTFLCGYLIIQLCLPLIAAICCKRSMLISDLDAHVKAIADAVTSIETSYDNGKIAQHLSQYSSCVEPDAKADIRATILQSYKEITDHVSWLRKKTAQVEALSRELSKQTLSEEDKNKLRDFGRSAETNVRKSANMLKAFDGVALDELRTDAEVSYAHSSLCLQNLGALLVLESLDEETWNALGQNRTRQMADGQTITLNPSGKKLEDESNVVQIVCRQAQS